MRGHVQIFARRETADEVDATLEMPLSLIGADCDPQDLRVASNAGRLFTSTAPATTAVLMAERSVVGALLADNGLFDAVIDITRSEDFSDEASGKVFAAITAVLEGRVDGISSADLITIASLPTISSLVSLDALQGWVASAQASPEIVATHAQVVSNAAAERVLAAAVAEAQVLVKGERSLAERTDSIQQALSVVADSRSLPIVSLGGAAIAALTEMADRANRGETGIGMTTGFPELDALLAGLHGGQLIIVAARPGIGKTAFAMSLGIGAAEAGHHVLMASMEMKAKELSKRALAIKSGVDSHALRVGALNEAEWEAVVTAGEYLDTLPFDVVDLDTVNLTALASLCRKRKRQGKLSLLIVDYLQIMETAATKNGTREQEVAALSRGLKKLAMQLGIPVLALSQLNRSVETRLNRRPQLSDLRESGALEQDADVIMFIHREATEATGSAGDETAEVIVEKQREGPTGFVSLGYAKRNTRFYSTLVGSTGACSTSSAARSGAST